MALFSPSQLKSKLMCCLQTRRRWQHGPRRLWGSANSPQWYPSQVGEMTGRSACCGFSWISWPMRFIDRQHRYFPVPTVPALLHQCSPWLCPNSKYSCIKVHNSKSLTSLHCTKYGPNSTENAYHFVSRLCILVYSTMLCVPLLFFLGRTLFTGYRYQLTTQQRKHSNFA